MTDSLPALIRRLNAQGWLVKPPDIAGMFLIVQPAHGKVMSWSAADPVKAINDFQRDVIDGKSDWPPHPQWRATVVSADVSHLQGPVFGIPFGSKWPDQVFPVPRKTEHGLSAALRRLGEAVDRMTEALA